MGRTNFGLAEKSTASHAPEFADRRQWIVIFYLWMPPGSDHDFQSFMAGSPLLGEGGGGLGNHDYRIPGYSWFAQDDYRASKTLTLNLGFRNEFLGAPYDTLCHTGNTDPNLANHELGSPTSTPNALTNSASREFPGR